jgi:multidrug efflux pump subunit AcrB
MWLIHHALRRPVTVLVAVLAVALASILALTRMPRDIFPNLRLPVIYVAQPYGGLDPAQMEGYVTSYYEYHFLFIAGVEHVESKSIQNMALIKLQFHPDTDMSQALAQTVSYVERSRAFMPPGTVPPFIMRFDAGSVPVGQLVFSSAVRPVGEMQDLALFRVRPLFATLPGVSAPPPFGASQRTVVVRVDPDRLRAYRMSPEEVVVAVARGNAIVPAGNVRTGELNRIAPVNSVVSDIGELEKIPVRTGSGATVFLRDIGTVQNGSDILTGYALVNGRRTVYIPVTKRAEASTLAVVQRVKEALPRMQTVLPEDVKISFEFDQSLFVTAAIRGLATEAGLGALLTGIMILLFLRDWRSAAIVVISIPAALVTSLVALWLVGESVNIMTLGGLALAVGILVDEATVAIENLHTHLARGETLARAVVAAGRETVTPRLLAMLSILAVFVPSFFMVGVARALFVPLALAVGFSMMASYVLSNSLVPVLASYFLRRHAVGHRASIFERVTRGYRRVLGGIVRFRWIVLAAYAAVMAIGLFFAFRSLGTDIFPTVYAGQFQLRLRAPVGTRVERTEVVALRALDVIREEAGPENVAITLGFVGTPPPNYPINSIYLWTSGPHEAVLLVALKRDAEVSLGELKEKLRARISKVLPQVAVSFESGDIVSQILNFGAPTPIEVAMNGPSLPANRAFAAKVKAELAHIPALRDLQYGQPLDYPTLDIRVDRERAGQLGLTTEGVARALAPATSSSRYVQPNYWRDPTSGVSYQVQVEIPQSAIASAEDVGSVPLARSGTTIRDVARVGYGTMPGEYDRYNMQRMVTLTANVVGQDLGHAADAVHAAIARAGKAPRGVTVNVRGQVPPMHETLGGLQMGLAIAIGVILLLLTGYFQSLRVALVTVVALPAVVAGVVAALLLTGSTINVPSFMGAIMAIGVSSANAILLVAMAEHARKEGKEAAEAAIEGAATRLRPILMTGLAMVAGMVPMALGLGEGGEQNAPLGRAVIGGLLASTVAVLVVLPAVFAIVQRRARRGTGSLHPDDAPEGNV